jgi:hypothetical protein
VVQWPALREAGGFPKLIRYPAALDADPDPAHGEADTVNPPGQSQEPHRGLKRYGVEASSSLPAEGHSLGEEKYRLTSCAGSPHGSTRI